jgi:hypothetical protein
MRAQAFFHYISRPAGQDPAASCVDALPDLPVIVVSSWISWQGLVLLTLANSAPVVVSWIAGQRAAWPIDFGMTLRDGGRLLGAHKTWRGLLAAALACGAAAPWLGLPALPSAGLGALAMAGDALSSFVKRRLRRRPGAWVPGLDQLPEAALPLLAGWRLLELDAARLVGTLLAFTLLGMLASRTVGSSRKARRS